MAFTNVYRVVMEVNSFFGTFSAFLAGSGGIAFLLHNKLNINHMRVNKPVFSEPYPRLFPQAGLQARLKEPDWLLRALFSAPRPSIRVRHHGLAIPIQAPCRLALGARPMLVRHKKLIQAEEHNHHDSEERNCKQDGLPTRFKDKLVYSGPPVLPRAESEQQCPLGMYTRWLLLPPHRRSPVCGDPGKEKAT
jgi:hypothetical protein